MIKKLIKLWDWLPIIWADEDWDFAYLLRLMQFKLSRMRPVIENGHSTECMDRAKEILTAEILLRNVVDEDPEDEWSAHYTQYDAHIDSTSDCANPNEHWMALELSAFRERRNWAALWSHLEAHAQGWWD